MKNEEIVKTLRRCDVKHCAGCPLLSKEGCIMALKDEAADLIEKLIDRCARYAEEIAVLQEREKWVPVTERLPEVWRNDETSELVNYMIIVLILASTSVIITQTRRNGFAWHYLVPSRTGGLCRMGRR